MQPSEAYGQTASSTARRSNSSSSTESLWHLINIKNIRKMRKRHNPLILLLMSRMKEFTFDPRCSKFDPRCNKFDPWLKLFSRKIIKPKRKNYNANQIRRFFSFWSVNVSRPNREIFIQRAWPFTWPFVTFLWEEKLINGQERWTFRNVRRRGTFRNDEQQATLDGLNRSNYKK
jgi:hypothetical protein